MRTLADFWLPIEVTLKVSIVAGIMVFMIGMLVARMMVHRTFKGKTIVETFFMLPLVLPPTVIGLLLMTLLGHHSLPGRLTELIFHHSLLFTWQGAVVASAVVAFPLMYQTAKAGFLSVDKEIIEASLVDGASKWKAFLAVELPLCSKALLSGFILSFTRALGEFGATLMVAGNIPGKTETLSMAVYTAYDIGETAKMWGWVAASVIISFLFLAASSKMRFHER
ncbi:molybdate ABC transporter permease subunit [Sporolactobacillus sp. THM7-7]|nr:molybdate ABC transporter permease subunit [Sporolactobacillus sp. THM7-7]